MTHEHASSDPVPTAVVTGGTAGLGLALAEALVADGWRVVVDGRDPDRLARATSGHHRLTGVVGDVADPTHRAALAGAVHDAGGRLDLLVHAASTLGPLPMRTLVSLDDGDLAAVLEVNAVAPLALTRLLLPALRVADGVLLSISSDAGVEHHGTWGAYGASKAALDHLTLTLAAEEGIAAYAVDPGDMRTQMHADAFPGEDLSDRPRPETVVPHLLGLLEQRPEPARYRAAELPVRPARAGGAVAS